MIRVMCSVCGCKAEVADDEAEDVHREGWYVSSAQMSRIFELLGE